jgi:creatinine amidohydrolase
MVTAVSWSEASHSVIAAQLAEQHVIVFPIGALEAHGPHLSVDADSVIAEAVARRALEHLVSENLSVLVLPALPYGVCRAAGSYPGTISIDGGLLTDLVLAISRELQRQGGRRLCFTVHHWDPPHVQAIDRAVEEINTWPGMRALVFSRGDVDNAVLSRDFNEGEGAGIRHGGRVETAMVLAEKPGRVRPDVMTGLESVDVDLVAAFRSGATTFAEAGVPDGYLGDPAAATAEEGEHMLEYLAAGLAKKIMILAGYE